MQDVGRRRDRVAGKEEIALGELRRGHESERRRLVPCDVAVGSGLQLRGRDAIVRMEDLRCLAERVPGVQRALVRLGDGVLARKLLRNPLLGRRHGALVEPEHDAEGEEVLGELDLLAAEPESVACTGNQGGHGDLEEVVPLQRTVVQRVRHVSRLAQIDVVEGIRVDDDSAARHQVAEVHLQRGRVHRHQDIGAVAWRMDIARREADLESRDTGERTGRRADLCREVRKRGDVVAEERGGGGELAPGQLHPVAGVAGESDRDSVELGDVLGAARPALWAGHAADSSTNCRRCTLKVWVSARPACAAPRA